MISLRSPLQSREFILGFGAQGTGKTRALLDIARRCPADRFYVLDNELESYDRLLETIYTDVVEVGNVHVDRLDEWGEIKQWVGDIGATVRRDDWVSVDSTGDTWPAVQNWYTEEVFGGQDMADYFVEVRKAKAGKREKGEDKKALGAFEGWMDWPVINQQYMRRFYMPLRKMNCHRWLTADAGRLGSDDEKEVRALYGPYGVKPVGQKGLGRLPQTALLMTKTRVGEFFLTTVKDRGRRELEEEAWGDFARDYLMKIAGWRPRNVEG